MHKKTTRTRSFFVVLGGLITVAAAACGSDESNTSGDGASGFGGIVATGGFAGGFTTGGAGGVAGGFGTGGVLGTGGAGGTAGTAGMSGAGGMMTDGGGECAHSGPPVVDPALFPTCDLCENARCIPNAAVPADTIDQLASCDADNKCVPDKLVETGGNFLFATCRSLEDAEGRCVPSCLPAVQAQAAYLPRDICEEDELCAPCYDPTTGEATGACGVSCDPGPTEDPKTFAECCGGIGSCVPTALVPEELQASLGPDTCTTADRLCAPNAFVDPTNRPATCRSVNDSEGRCIPDCVPAVADRAEFLSQGTCMAGELCAPCYDPTTGEDTGACGINGDMPTEDPKTFDECCGMLGSCVPSDLVPADQRDFLGPDSCSDTEALCAPKAFVDSSYIPPTCESIAGAEGRCLPACLPDVAVQADRLPRSTCAADHLCAPCYDPLSGEATGACNLNGDMPGGPPQTFDDCCGILGSCVPSSLVPTEQQSLLGKDVCTGADDLCVPDDLADTSFVPPRCDSIGGFEGRCLPGCLPDIAAQADRLSRASCGEGHLCAPCYDPLTGDATGACAVNGDMPEDPPGTFADCCGGLGACVPTNVVPAEQRSLLDQNTCTTAGDLCAPRDLADPDFTPPSCASINGFEGRCLPSCLPDIAAQADRLPVSSCDPGHLCAPCYDPLTGDSTGACDLNGDEPVNPPATFPTCCGGRGSCVPTALVPAEQQSLLGPDTCTGTGNLCAPTALASDPTYKPPSCNTFQPQNREGRCLPACLPPIAAQSEQLLQETCGAGELCAPCYDPVNGGSTGACEVNGDMPARPDPGPFVTCTAAILGIPIGDGDGRCVPPHLVDPLQAIFLSPSPACQASEICAPCEFGGTPTGACPP